LDIKFHLQCNLIEENLTFVGTEGKWTHDPFGGVIADGYIWGRGSMDDKGTIVITVNTDNCLFS
jgi:hypothetical protein